MTDSLRVRELAPGAEAERFASLEPTGPQAMPQPSPTGARRVVAERAGAVVARVALHRAEDLVGAPGTTGMVGHFEAADEAAGVAVLRRAAQRLAEEGAVRVVGPMNGSTWARYRLALPPDPGSAARPPFLSEPTNPSWYPACFEAAGFEAVEHYLSRLVPDLDSLAEPAARARERATERDIRIETLEPAAFEGALDELYDLSLEAFSDNPYYSPLPRAEFLRMYEPIRPLVGHGFVLLARPDQGRAAGFLFGFPDLLDPSGAPTRVIIKTLAVAADARGLGLGTLLMHECHRRAAAVGYHAAIHALMHVDNPSHRISRHGGDVLRRYALYGWTP